MKKIAAISLLLLLSVLLFVSSAETRRTHAAFASADLSVTKVDSPDPVNTGSNLTYTITVNNNGPDAAANASWSDTLPAGTTFVSMPNVGGWSCTTPAAGDNGTVSCSNPSFAVGSSVFTLTVAVAPTVAAGSTLSNTATATSSTPDGNPGNNSGTANTTVLSPASVTGNKSRSGGSSAGANLTYLIILSNSSNSNQQDNPGNEFTDVLPADLTLLSASASAGTATANTGTNTVTWNGVVPANDSVTITIDAKIKTGAAGHTIANTGTISYDADGNGTNESSASTNTDSFVVGAAVLNADLGVTKTAPNTAPSDSDVPYTITVTNGGPDTATSATLTDTLPGTMTFVSLSQPAGWSCNSLTPGLGGTLTCSRDLPAGSGPQVFTLVGHIPPGTPDGTFYNNMATVTTTSTDSTSENNTATAGTTVGCLTNPIVTTSADSGPGSLRRAIQDACNGATITFDMSPGHVTSPITLTTGQLLINKSLTITGPGASLLTIGGNNADRVFGILSGTVQISGLTISGGKIVDNLGGGIFNSGTLTLLNSTVSGNNAVGSLVNQGGGIFNNGTLTLTSSTVSGNSSTGNGGGIGNVGTVNLVNSTVSGNTASFGGGIFINVGTVNITNGTISGNNARESGGGIRNNGGALTLMNSTVINNRSDSDNSGAEQGGGISSPAGTVTLKNTIVAGNFRGTGTTRDDISGVVDASSSFNLIGDGTNMTGISNGSSGNQVGSSGSPINAMLGALGNNGGPTQTHLLLPGSSAINAGSNANLPQDTFDLDNNGNTIEPLPVDQRGIGFPRIVNSTVDIGAVEVNYAISATAGTPQSTAINTAFGTQLQATVTESGNPQGGVTVTFTAPGSGPSGTFPGSVTTANAATNGSGVATAPVFTANTTVGGPYNVVASIGTGLPTTNFSLTNTKANQTITFGALPPRTFGDPDFMVSATASSGLPVSFSASGQCTVTSPSPGTVHITGAGSCTITASQAGNGTYNPAPDVPQSFSIGKANQTITFAAIPNKTFGDPDFIVNPTASSGLTVSLGASGNCTVTTPSPGTVHLTGAGACTITASQAGNANFNAAANVPQSFNIAKASQAITFNALANKTFGDPDFTVSATASSGLPVSFTASGQCTVSGNTVHLTGAGSCTIEASQAGDENYNAAIDIDRTFSIAKANQTITFNALANKTFGDPDFNVSATASSGLSVSFSAAGNCTVTGNTVHLTGAGACTITASQAGNANYNAAPDVPQSFTIAKANQTITVGTHAPASATYNTSFTVAATASSALAVSYSSAGACTNSGAVFLMTSGTGTCTVKYDQAGNGNFNAAPQVTELVTAQKAATTLSLTSSVNPSVFGQSVTFTATVAPASGGTPTSTVQFVIDGSNFGAPVTLSGGMAQTSTASLTVSGSPHSVSAAYSGDPNFLNSTGTLSGGQAVNKAPTSVSLTSSVNPSVFGQNVTFTATVTPASGGTPTSTVQFVIDGSNFGAPVTLSGGMAQISTASLTVSGSPHSVGATYSGDPSFLNSTGTLSGGQAVNKAATTTALSSSLNPSALAQSVTFTATVTSTAGTPTGTAQFKDNGANLGSPLTLNGSGVATFTTSTLTAGTHTITADYSGDGNFNASTGTLSGGQVVNNRALIRFSQSTYSVNENGGGITITVNRGGDTSTAVTVDYASPDDSAALTVLPCSTANGVASPRCDFTTAVGTLRFAGGETSKTFDVLISQDSYVEGPETLTLTLSNPTGGAAFAQPSDASAIVTIVDDDFTPTTINPIDDAQNFVRQTYHDFLNREPDAAGLSFWTNNITSCGNNPSCIAAARVNTSAAFFLSVEFQQTGYYVYRTYKTALGDIAPPTVPVPFRFINFLRDTQEVQRGVVVGQGNWQAQLDANKQAFALFFVQRPEFLNRYPSLTGAAAFVNALDTNAGTVLTAGERAALITELSPNPADASLRADVLMKIAENQLLQQGEFNRAFVLMQYYGYLRRNPDAAPDSNFSGFTFWLNKLNQFNGNYVAAEMVKAFITSDEYRRRFGP